MTLLISLFHALDPRIDLALAKPQLGADTEPIRPTPLAAEVNVWTETFSSAASSANETSLPSPDSEMPPLSI